MNKKVITLFIMAILMNIIGYIIHLKACVHSNKPFELFSWNFLAHTLLYGSLLVMLLAIKKLKFKREKSKDYFEIVSETQRLSKDATNSEMKWMVFGARCMQLMHDKRFILALGCSINTLLAYLIYKIEGNIFMIPISFGVGLLIHKFLTIRLFFPDLDDDKKRFDLELKTLVEIKADWELINLPKTI